MGEQTIFLKFEKEINGKIRKFWIQQVSDDQKELVVAYFSKYFMADEPLCKSLKMIEDEESTECCKKIWWDVIKQNKSLACFTELDDGRNKMVAANLCYHALIDKKVEVGNTPERMKVILETLGYIGSLKDISKELGISEYLGALGLVVIPEYRGYNIGLHVLEARKLLCEKLGLKATITVFTSPASQRLAEKAGFKDLASLTFDALEKIKPSLKFPNINNYSKCIRNMYILY